ncbi:hypothetical protein S40285_04426 [Stachybotrys chlorohalonatus IBT 40285]|uniref:Rhodopsin domain-containing protein n=1 Tax=Stachybotrys chlorohalonatus (strain IBT 40285) TaxID=1283841 RepID=A0A084R1Y0_STAC4|nr:hypothetical protein S40285_04426 [Stachybotrys chlorohalonata IBT 40285]
MDPTQMPAGVPPEGVMPNFVDPPSLSPVYRGIIYSFVPLMFVFVVCRLYVRTRTFRDFGFDDLFCILGASSIIAYCGVLIPLLDRPLGRHLWDVPVSDITNSYLESSTIILVLFFLGALFVKLTLLLLYRRLFKIHRLASIMIWGGVAVSSVFYLVSVILILDHCVPEGGQTWLSMAYTGSCTPVQNGLSEASGIFGLVSDLYILAIPVWLISRLNSPTKRKVGVMAVFLTGLIACGFSAAGLAARFQWRQADGTYSMLYVFGILELNIGNICACMPVLVPLVRGLAQSLSSVWQSVNHYYYVFTHNPYTTEDDTGKGSRSTEETRADLPEVPRGTFSGLRTFMRNYHRSSAATTEHDTRGSTTVLATQDSNFHDYHSQLKNIWEHDAERNMSSEMGDSGSRTLPGSSGTGSQRHFA